MATQTQQKPRSWNQDISFAPPAATGNGRSGSRARPSSPRASGGFWEAVKEAPMKIKLMVAFIVLSGSLAVWQLSGVLGSGRPALSDEVIANDIKEQLPGD